MNYNCFQNSSTFSDLGKVENQRYFDDCYLMRSEHQLKDLLQILYTQYWDCSISMGAIDFEQDSGKCIKQKRNIKKPLDNTHLMLKRYHFKEKADKILRLLLSVKSDYSLLINGSRKADPKYGPVSNTRSSYIGVSGNGAQWQALITINKRKTYIGSYESELDAAIAFDFHCILLHSLKAKTNFGYSKANIVSMIANYKENNNCFKPMHLRLD